jgi:hypothetical protein
VSATPSLAERAEAILAAHRGVATKAAIAAMRMAIAEWLAARPASAPPTDVTPDARDARRLLMEAMDRAQRNRGIG